jgi:hypothetical protein
VTIAETLCPFTMPLFSSDQELAPTSPLAGAEVGDWLRIDFDGDEGKQPVYRRVCVVGAAACHVPMPDHMPDHLQTMRFWITGTEAGREVCRPNKAFRATARPATAEEIEAALAEVDPLRASAAAGEGGEWR